MINHGRMASAQDFFGQLWKEYALSDSRYMTADTMVLCMETMTVVCSRAALMGMLATLLANLPPLDVLIAALGPAVFCRRIFNFYAELPASSTPAGRLHESPLR